MERESKKGRDMGASGQQLHMWVALPSKGLFCFAAVKKKEKKSKSGEKKDSHVGKIQGESGQKAAAPLLALGKEDQVSKRSSEPARKASEEKIEEGQLLPPILDPKQPLPSATRKAGKQASPALPPVQLPSLVPPKKEAPKTVLAELKKKIAPSLEAGLC